MARKMAVEEEVEPAKTMHQKHLLEEENLKRKGYLLQLPEESEYEEAVEEAQSQTRCREGPRSAIGDTPRSSQVSATEAPKVLA